MDRLKDLLGDRPLKGIFTALGLPEKIGGAVLDVLCSRGARLWNVEEEADKLRRTKERIRAVLEDAEQRRFIDHDSVKLWLRELRAAAFDVDALLDRLRTITAASRLAAAEHSRKRKRPWPSFELGPWRRWELDEKIANINERLDISTGTGKGTGCWPGTGGGLRLRRRSAHGSLKLPHIATRGPLAATRRRSRSSVLWFLTMQAWTSLWFPFGERQALGRQHWHG